MCFSKISGFNSQPQSRQLSLGKLIYTALYIISISNPLATWWEEATHWKRPWFRGRLRAEGEVGNRGWDGWMALLTRWTWVWANSGRWWRTRKPRMLQSMGLQRTRLDLMKWSELKVAQLCLTLCNPMDCRTPDLPVHHQLLEFTQTHDHWAGDAIQPSHPLSSPSPPALNLSQHQSLFQWVSSSHQEFQLQHQSFQRIFRTDFL